MTTDFFGTLRNGKNTVPKLPNTVLTDSDFGVCLGSNVSRATETAFQVVVAGSLTNASGLKRTLSLPYNSDDAKIVLAAFKQWGLSCIECFEGHFAVLIYDSHRQEMVLFRDPLGVVPLYFTSQRNGLPYFFGTNQRDIFPFIQDSTLNVKAVELFLSGGDHPPFFAEVNEVPAGHYAVFTILKGFVIHSYQKKRVPLLDKNAISFAHAQVVRLLDTSIHLNVKFLEQTGLLLFDDVASAGLTGLVSISTEKTLHTAIASDSIRSRRVSKRFGTAHSIVDTRQDLLKQWAEIIWQTGLPVTSGSALTLVALAKYLSKDVKQCLVALGSNACNEESIHEAISIAAAVRQSLLAWDIDLFAPFLNPDILHLQRTFKEQKLLEDAFKPLLGTSFKLDNSDNGQDNLTETASDFLADGRFKKRNLGLVITPSNQVACAAAEIWFRLFLDKDEEAFPFISGDIHA